MQLMMMMALTMTEDKGAVHSDEAFEAQPFPPESFSQAHGNYDGDVGVDDHDH